VPISLASAILWRGTYTGLGTAESHWLGNCEGGSCKERRRVELNLRCWREREGRC
jgi:hypothetical protein